MTILLAVAHAVAFIAVGWAASESFLRRTVVPENVGAPERALFSVVGGVAFAVALMVGNIVTGGAVFGLAGIVPAIGLVVLLNARSSLRRPRDIPWIPLVLIVGVLLFVFAAPGFVGGSGLRTGDSPWHLGWSEQLLSGESIPTGPAPNFGRNAYPWGWHAVVATMVRLIPGTTSLTAYEGLQLILLFSIPLAAASLARRIDPAAGWAAAIAVSLIGGFGWVIARAPAFSASPKGASFGADLVVASPNSLYGLFPPPLPRELGVVLLAAAGVWLVFAAWGEGRPAAFTTGVCLGLLGLVSAPLFISALVWLIATFLVGAPRNRSNLPWVLAPGLAIFAIWAGPVLADYLRFGGFVDITPRLGKEWPLWTALSSWGLALPASAFGIFVAARDRLARPLLACLVGTGVLLAAALARGAFDWSLAGNATLLHQGRVWPVAHLLGAVFASIGMLRAYRWVKSHSEAAAGACATVVLIFAVVSPLLASLGLAKLISARAEGFVYGSQDYGTESFLSEASSHLTPDDVVQVQGSDRLAFGLFEYSGVKLAAYDDPRLEGNDLRIRYAELAEAWGAQMAAGGFKADYLVLPDPDPARFEPLVVGEFEGQQWSLVEAG